MSCCRGTSSYEPAASARLFLYSQRVGRCNQIFIFCCSVNSMNNDTLQVLTVPKTEDLMPLSREETVALLEEKTGLKGWRPRLPYSDEGPDQPIWHYELPVLERGLVVLANAMPPAQPKTDDFDFSGQVFGHNLGETSRDSVHLVTELAIAADIAEDRTRLKAALQSDGNQQRLAAVREAHVSERAAKIFREHDSYNHGATVPKEVNGRLTRELRAILKEALTSRSQNPRIKEIPPTTSRQ
jgi:hypothetical protein